MTSSQALLVNLFGPLGSDLEWLRATLAAATNRQDFSSVIEWHIEFARPARAAYLGDMTRVDGYFVVGTPEGPESIVLELKYTDRFSSRRLDLLSNHLYRQLAETSNLWREPALALANGEVSQLLRCHALGARTLEVDYGRIPTTLLLVSHPADPTATSTFDTYQAHLVDRDRAVHVTLDRFLESARTSASFAGRAEVDHISVRYLRHDLSEAHWQGHLAEQGARRRSKPASTRTALPAS